MKRAELEKYIAAAFRTVYLDPCRVRQTDGSIRQPKNLKEFRAFLDFISLEMCDYAFRKTEEDDKEKEFSEYMRSVLDFMKVVADRAFEQGLKAEIDKVFEKSGDLKSEH